MKDVRTGLLFLEKLDKHETCVTDLVDEDIHQILIFAFQVSASEYWPKLALKVLENHKNYMNEHLRTVLEEASRMKWASQNFRHRVKKLLKNG